MPETATLYIWGTDPLSGSYEILDQRQVEFGTEATVDFAWELVRHYEEYGYEEVSQVIE